ncbi:HIRA-interacting protein 3-like [Neodiprion fabricii]|uniref:HIRA-interacting protein 3-like n=1 Tax=Neodiprion fabricii TaxID=2872261 RepID=UPI001ED9441F|nr:HIRA-interacting protein 3-like [Neodiprion fabricii]XP_046415345.1 HIRA-interacting protein 3-like [Neodiprion fabricii]XP_046415346.1 HIRA-interacting protein 3-like [Neodiprion fabricii]XP_046415347.1 HIRA-interacting protein 3-like [Neodiprion fabricii]
MMDSDKSDNGESQTTGKRMREDNSGDEKCDLPSKRPRSESVEPSELVDSKKDAIAQVTNGDTSPSKEHTDTNKVDDEHKNGETEETDDHTKPIVEDEVPVKSPEPVEAIDKNNEDMMKEEDIKIDKKTENEPVKEKSIDSEVVDGLELSVECASDKEASSSENDEEKASKPRPKTIIVTAEPNDSELEVGTSEAEKSDSNQKVTENDVKTKKRTGKRKSFTKVTSSRSEDSLDSNSDDEDYSPQNKKKLKKAATLKKVTPRKTKPKKNRKSVEKSVTETDSDSEKSKSEDEDMNLADRAKKRSAKNVNKISQKDESNSESSNEADDMNDSDDKNKKNGKRKSKDQDPNSDKKIKGLKKYIITAGIRVKYQDLWSGCTSNRQRIIRMQKLLQDNGIQGRPTLEKCKKLKIKNAAKKEVAELDKSNIISEGRVTRSRRSEGNKEGTPTPTKHREVRKILKRIQPVCDSDTE